MAFSSARGNKVLENEKTSRDADTAQGRVGVRSRGDTEADRFRDGRSNPLRRRGDGEQDGDGWNMVKPRKSFGAEGAERFHGKMGGNFRDDKKPARDGNKDEREAPRERPGRAFDVLTRDRDVPDSEARVRNGLGRNKGDNWRATDAGEASAPEKKDRDRMKSWRDRDRDAPEPSDDRNAGRTNERRWGRESRDQRQEREPEWLDEQAEEREAHTQQDFQKWMEQMKKAKSASSTSVAKPTTTTEAVAEAVKPSLPAPPVEAGPDKFFLAFGGASAAADVTSPGEPKDSAPKASASGKSSRFTSFFSQAQGDSKPRTESSTPLTGPPANGSAAAAGSATVPPGLGALLAAAAPAGAVGGGGGAGAVMGGAPPEEERQAFQQLLAKLQKASLSATPPAASPFAAPPPGSAPEMMMKKKKKKKKEDAVGSPDPFQQYGGAPGAGLLGRPPSQQPQQEIVAPRPQPQTARPEQLLQDIVGRHQRVSSQGSTSRPESQSARNNSNTEFLMNLMRMAPDGQRGDHSRVQHHPPPQLGPQVQQKHSAVPSYNEREQDFAGRENRNNMRPQPPPGFPMDEPFHNVERETRPSQPTQILQRPPPPGLDQMPPNWMAGAAQMPPPQPRGPMLPPPPGLVAGGLGGPGRNMPIPPMFPPNFAHGGMLSPDAMGGMPPRNMPLPPPGFFNRPPPHGFLPPGIGGFNGPPLGPEGFGGPPFEARGIPPPSSAGNNGRGVNYQRL
ncbi:hypothetical protein E4U41_007207 [Claviceps citrina]|nr:hypothetical protein E4U41_007207 [Claviceps citrina]